MASRAFTLTGDAGAEDMEQVSNMIVLAEDEFQIGRDIEIGHIAAAVKSVFPRQGTSPAPYRCMSAIFAALRHSGGRRQAG
jgi:hypothetical protein